MGAFDRERLFVAGGIGAVILLIIGILATQALGKKSDLLDSIQSKKRNLIEIRKLAGEHMQAAKKNRSLEAKIDDRGTPLLSYMEKLSRQASITNPALKVMRTTPNEHFEEISVELKVKELNLRQLTTLLKLIEKSPRYLRVRYFQIKTPYAHPELMNIAMQISAYSKRQEKKSPAGEAD